MIELLSAEFFRNALFAGLLTAVVCGIIGTYVVVNRLVFIAGGISHTAYGGIGFAVFLGMSPILGAVVFACTAAVIIALISFKNSHRTDTFIGVLWAFGMALGIILTDLTPGYNVDMMSYLFGSILTVPKTDIYTLIILCVSLTLIIWRYYADLLLMSYDSDFAKTTGINTKFLYVMLLLMTAFSVVLVIRVVGIILVIAMLSIPPYIAEKRTGSLFKMILLSIFLNIIFVVTGLAAAFYFNLTSGAAIIMTASIGFIISETAKKFKTFS